MFGSHPSRWITFLVFGALTAFGCVGTTDTGPQSETGSLSLDLVIADASKSIKSIGRSRATAWTCQAPST